MRMTSAALAVFTLLAGAAPARADTRFLAYDAADRVTQALTRGVTLEVERGLFGAIRVRQLFSTTARGSAGFVRGGPGQALDALPEGATETDIYAIDPTGDGRGLVRALCPGADEVWVVMGRVRMARPLTMQAVGRWADGTYRPCVALQYEWRGEWATPPSSFTAPPPPASAPAGSAPAA